MRDSCSHKPHVVTQASRDHASLTWCPMTRFFVPGGELTAVLTVLHLHGRTRGRGAAQAARDGRRSARTTAVKVTAVAHHAVANPADKQADSNPLLLAGRSEGKSGLTPLLFIHFWKLSSRSALRPAALGLTPLCLDMPKWSPESASAATALLPLLAAARVFLGIRPKSRTRSRPHVRGVSLPAIPQG